MFNFDPSKSYPTETQSTSLIRFQDCDPLRHLNNAKYFDYYFNAREDQVPKLYDVENAHVYREFGSIWVVYNHQIAYLKSAMMGEWVQIGSRIIWFDKNTVVTEFYMTDIDRKHLKNLLWSTLKYVDVKTAKSIDHQPKILQYLEIVKHPGIHYDPGFFNQRVKEVKEEIEK